MMNDIVARLLSKWIEITEYDENQTSFNLLSSKYAFHRCGQLIKQLMNFDDTRIIACLYAKASFETVCKDISIKLSDLMKDNHIVDEYLQMWKDFNSPEMIESEHNLIRRIIQLTQLRPAIGDEDIDHEMDMFRDSVEYVAEELTKCNTVSYYMQRGTYISKDLTFMRQLSVFNTTTECILNIEKSQDGIYLCYISEFNSTGGYFTYIIKSGNNIISINDKVFERYVGQHTRSRNNRFLEQKKWHIFPYNDMISAEGSDYLGYAKSLICQAKDVDISTLSSNYIYCIMLSVVLLISKFGGRSVDDLIENSIVEEMFIDTMLTVNQTQDEVNALVPINAGSLVLQNTRSLNIDLPSEKIADNSLQSTFSCNDKDAPWMVKKNFGCYTNANSYLVELYGKDFKLDGSKILKRRWPQLTDGSDSGSSDNVVSEFIGSEQMMRTEYYRQCSLQLRSHILNEMSKEYHAAGGYDGVVNWYYSELSKRTHFLLNLCIDYYIKYLKGDKHLYQPDYCSISLSEDILFGMNQGETNFYVPKISCKRIINKPKHTKGYFDPTPIDYYDLCSEHTANVWFYLIPCTWKNIEFLLDEEVPKILKGYNWANHTEYAGNSLLDNCDPVATIGNPFGSNYNDGEYNKLFPQNSTTSFGITLGVSKRTLNKLVKEFEANGKIESL